MTEKNISGWIQGIDLRSLITAGSLLKQSLTRAAEPRHKNATSINQHYYVRVSLRSVTVLRTTWVTK